MSEIIRAYWLQILLAYFSIMGIILLWKWMKERGKIQARIKNPDGTESIQWVKPSYDQGKSFLVFEKQGKKKTGWKAEFTNKAIIFRSAWFGIRHFKSVDILVNAPKCIEYDHVLKEAEQYRLTKKDILEFSKWEALKARYSKLQGENKGLIWIILILLIINLIIQILPYLGRFR